MTKKIDENEFLRIIAGAFLRAPNQINNLLEADAELIDIGNNQILALTYDAIVEEINTGLYTDYYQIGWMGVTVSISDLAAVGSSVLGLLIDLRLPPNLESTNLIKLQQGINDACQYYGCYILGGDTNSNNLLQIGSTGVGICYTKPLTRIGSKPNDAVYVSGKMGLGSAFAYNKYFNQENISFLPKAQLKLGQLISKYASSCIDTSDGFFSAISQIMELNNLGITFQIPIKEILHSSCLNICTKDNIPDWIFLAGPHGEYELLFTIPQKNISEFEKKLKKIKQIPLRVGQMTSSKYFFCESNKQILNVFEISNLYGKTQNISPKEYFNKLMILNKKMML